MSCIIVDTTCLLYLGDGGLFPTDADIAAAPYLYNWSISDDEFWGGSIIGKVIGHLLGDEDEIVLSPPTHADLDRRWLKTENDLYRLGPHKNVGSRDV
ncbi:hypothetical protein [Devosia sp. Leaf64]|uniref:hypothetical protein n=1 Tax=Devosia sp. Leaf64 TaxID=1736229 RepID=UPI0007132C8A|nr:hypothetical protein [Devosia sp. Leaf64]KQN75089.1 hypothetical protein ASE94_01860 [Devosia sp. Leaf64]